MRTLQDRTDRQSQLISATQTKPGEMIHVYKQSDRPELGTVICCAQQRHETGWLVSHYGSGLMPVMWSFELAGWVFDCRSYGLNPNPA